MGFEGSSNDFERFSLVGERDRRGERGRESRRGREGGGGDGRVSGGLLRLRKLCNGFKGFRGFKRKRTK